MHVKTLGIRIPEMANSGNDKLTFINCKYCHTASLDRSSRVHDFVCAACENTRKSNRRSESMKSDENDSHLLNSIPVSSRAKKVLTDSLKNTSVAKELPQDVSLPTDKSLIETLDGDLQCSICLDLFAKPVTLGECGHTFCFLCLRADVAKRMKDELVPSCPTCRHTINVPPSAPSVTIDKIVRTVIAAKSKSDRKEQIQRLKDADDQFENILEKCDRKPWAWFKHGKPLFDRDDGVYRCPACVWELESGRCTNPSCQRVWKVDEHEEGGSETADRSDANGSGVDEEDDNSHLDSDNQYDSEDSFICDEVESAPSDENSSNSEDASEAERSGKDGDDDDDEGQPKRRIRIKEAKQKSSKPSKHKKRRKVSKLNSDAEVSQEDQDEDEDSDEGLSAGAKMLKERRRAIEAAKQAKVRAKKGVQPDGKCKAKKRERAHSVSKQMGLKAKQHDCEHASAEEDGTNDTRKGAGGSSKSGGKKRSRDAVSTDEDEECLVARRVKRRAEDTQQSKKAQRRRLVEDSQDDDHEEEEEKQRSGGAAATGEESETDKNGKCDDEEEGGSSEREAEEEEDEPCRVCGQNSEPAETLLCDGCDGAYHMRCVGLEELPHGDWYCKPCRKTRRRLAVREAE